MSAAYWEDDSPCDKYAKELIKSITIDNKLILDAWKLYDIEMDDIFLLFNDRNHMLKMLKDDRISEILDYIDDIDYDIDYDSEYSDSNLKFLEDVLNNSRYKIKITYDNSDKINLELLDRLEEYGLLDYIDYKNINSKNAIEYLTGSFELISNLLKNRVIDLDSIYNNSHIISTHTYLELLKNIPELLIKTIENEIWHNYWGYELYEKMLKYITKNKTNFKKHKQNLINIISKIDNRDILLQTLDKIDDDDIEIACLQKLHRKSSKHIQRRIIEKIKDFNSFI